jgi:Zn-dependent M28 family amino/carboxypeptidase
VIDGLAAQAATYTDLSVQTSLSPFASDHVPFIEAGLPGVLTIEGSDHANDRVHTAADTFDHIDLGLACQILRMNIAYVASLAASSSARPATRHGTIAHRAPGTSRGAA